MDDQFENQRLRALLLASRNQMDWLWHLADQQGGENRRRVESVLKLVGAIDYALGIEPYTLDLENAGASPAPVTPSAPAASSASRPLDVS